MKKHTQILLRMLLISSVLVAAFGAVLKYRVMEPLGIARTEDIIQLPFVLLADDQLASELSERMREHLNPEPVETEPAEEPYTEPAVISETVESTQPTDATEATEPTEPEPTEPVYVPVDESWFDDALFIGDSRTEGLQYVDNLGKADYFCDVGMTVHTVLNNRCYDDGFGKKKLEQVLTDKTYGKVYIHLGLNECGGDHEKLMEKYRELVELVREKQPKAVIILQAVMTVSERKAEDPKFALERIQALNRRISEYAEEEELYYQDTNAWLSDENGYLHEDLNRDGAHLEGPGYLQWSQWILEQAGWIQIA